MSIRSNLPNNPNVEILKAKESGIFTNCIFKAIPVAFDESMSYYETLCGLLYYLKEVVIPTVNNNADAVAELQGLYEELKTYVDNYFTNLDVQEEINNKLDQMVEDGTLAKIINQEIFGEINKKLDLLMLPKKFVLIGDSYGNGYTPEGNITSWCELFKNSMNLSNENCIINAKNGYGFARPNYLFSELLNELSNDNNVTDVVILGGYNDSPYSYSEINIGIKNCKNIVNSKFPNAKLHIGMIGWANISDRLFGLFNTINDYKISCENNNVNYIYNIEYTLHDYFTYFASDNIHPNENGQIYIAYNLTNYFINNNVEVNKAYINCGISINSEIFSDVDLSTVITQSMINENVSFTFKKNFVIPTQPNITFKCDGTEYLIGKFTNSYLIGNTHKTICFNTTAIIKSDNLYYKVPCVIKLYNQSLYISFIELNESKTNFKTFENVSQIQIFNFSANVIANIN